jgi:tetratricopeptide (TPR) repeat protein
MAHDGISLTAREAFERGSALVQQGSYEQAIPELQLAEALFRQDDARGHPFPKPLANGVSGLANSLFLSGRCYEQLEDHRLAARCYETSLINAKFEKRRPFRSFSQSVNRNLCSCYERLLASMPAERVEAMLGSELEISIDRRFPFSPPVDAVVLFRLYELDPDRFARFRDAYHRARARDVDIRKREKKSDETTMRKLSFTIWTILIVIWAIYGIVVIKTLITKQ